MERGVADRRWVDTLEADLRLLADPIQAEAIRRYLHSDLDHLGVGVPALRRAVRTAVRRRDGAPATASGQRGPGAEAVGPGRVPWRGVDVCATAELLWASPLYELRLAAEELLGDREASLGVDELPVVERLLRRCHTWALVDPLAIGVAGPILERLAAAGSAGADTAEAWRQRWIADDDFWLRRSALLSHLGALRRGGGDFDAFGRLADRVLEEREFFIRKAIGWVLRDTGRRRPELVAAWVAPRWSRLSGVTRREVAKVVPAPPA